MGLFPWQVANSQLLPLRLAKLGNSHLGVISADCWFVYYRNLGFGYRLILHNVDKSSGWAIRTAKHTTAECHNICSMAAAPSLEETHDVGEKLIAIEDKAKVSILGKVEVELKVAPASVVPSPLGKLLILEAGIGVLVDVIAATGAPNDMIFVASFQVRVEEGEHFPVSTGALIKKNKKTSETSYIKYM